MPQFLLLAFGCAVFKDEDCCRVSTVFLLLHEVLIGGMWVVLLSARLLLLLWASCLAGMPQATAAAAEPRFPSPTLQEARTVQEIRDILARHDEDLPLLVPPRQQQQQQQRDDGDRIRGHPRRTTRERSTPTVAATYGFNTGGFYHSVASGDPTQNSVMIWTRYTPVSIEEVVTLEFRMAEIPNNNNTTTTSAMDDSFLLDPARNPNLRRGRVTVTKATDFVAKIDMTGLPSGTHFVYVFLVVTTSNNAVVVASPIGHTRTAPAPNDPGADALTYAHFSCAQFLNGFFHPYDIASTIQDLDLAVFVGDYIYECAYYCREALLVYNVLPGLVA